VRRRGKGIRMRALGARIPYHHGVSNRPIAQGVECDRGKDDRALDGALPIRTDAKECERRADDAEEHDAQHGATDTPPAPGTRMATDDAGGDHFELDPEPSIAGDLVEAYRVEKRRQPSQAPRDSEDTKRHDSGMEAPEPGCRGIGTGCVAGAARRDVSQSP